MSGSATDLSSGLSKCTFTEKRGAKDTGALNVICTICNSVWNILHISNVFVTNKAFSGKIAYIHNADNMLYYICDQLWKVTVIGDMFWCLESLNNSFITGRSGKLEQFI